MAVGGKPLRASAISTKQSASVTRFGEQACIAYSRWDLTNVLWRGANAYSDSSANDHLIRKSIHIALEAASVSRSLTTLATCMELPGQEIIEVDEPDQ